MAKNWRDFTDDDLLNYSKGETGLIAQYARISEKRTQEALGEVKIEISNLTHSTHETTNRLVGVGNELIDSIVNDTAAQAKHQKAIFLLTGVIAAATVAYTGITAWSVITMREANELQKTRIASQAPPTVTTKAPP